MSLGHVNPVTLERTAMVTTNTDSVTRRLMAIRDARAAAEALGLEALTEAEVIERLAQLRDQAEASVPAACGESEASATPEASRG